MKATDLKVSLEQSGFTLRAEGDKLLVSPASKLTPELRVSIAAAKGELLALLGEHFCPGCQRQTDDKRRCWRCGYRACYRCGRDTASAFIQLCVACGMGS